jgi:hypothetical protein
LIADLNSAISDSGISGTTVKIAGTVQASRTFQWNEVSDALSWLSSDTAIATERTTTKADLVSCLINGTGTPIGVSFTAGMGALPGSASGNKNAAHSVFLHSVSSGTFVHEIGHNLGSHHDKATHATGGVFPYSHGNHFTGDDGKDYRTVMAYSKNGETRVLKFSGPNVLHQGVATGIADDADNAKSVDNMLPVVKKYY